jgi:hypothetical protein
MVQLRSRRIVTPPRPVRVARSERAVSLVAPASPARGSLERAVRDGRVGLDGEGQVIIPPGMVTCPLCLSAGIPEYVYNETNMVRSHLRAMHHVRVAPGNTRMGRPRPKEGVVERAVIDAQQQESRQIRRLVSQYRVTGVSGEMVSERARRIMISGLNKASKAATIIHALEPISKVYPEFEGVLLASARDHLVQEAARDSADFEEGIVELSWSRVADFVAAAHAYAQIKSAQVAEGWLPLTVDIQALSLGALSVSDFGSWSSQALELCVHQRVLQRLVPRPPEHGGSVVQVCPMLHLDATWAERVWTQNLDGAVTYAIHAYTPALSPAQAFSLARAYVIPWMMAKILHHHLGMMPAGLDWSRMAAHFEEHPSERIKYPAMVIPFVPGEVVPLSDEFLQSAGEGVLK